MPQVCALCRLPQPVPVPLTCSGCGAEQGAPDATGPRSGSDPTQAGSRRASARVLLQLADGRTSEHVLGHRTSIGRHPANTIRLADREVSKEHAAIEQLPDGWILRDLDSSNGTFVNGRRVQEARLREGDDIAMGNSRLRFRSGEAGRPEVVAGRAPGVTVVGSAQAEPAFLAQLGQHENEFRPIDELTDPAALRADYEKLRIAHEFHRQIGLERDLKSLLEKILRVSFQLLAVSREGGSAADNGVILLLDPSTGQLTPEAVLHRDGQESEVLLSDTVLQRVVETRQAVLTADAILDARFSSSQSIVSQGIRSAMAVPMVTQEALKGVLFIDTRLRTNAFSEKDLKILAGIAAQAAIAIENAELARQIEQEAVARNELSRFLSPKVAEMVVTGKVEMLRQGRLEEVTILFADIRSFTSLAESEDPQATVQMLNEFFTAMANVIFRHEGNLDKFIGDCVMAVWGPPTTHPDDPERALRAAAEMQNAVDLLNDRRADRGLAPIQVGIGVNTGKAVVGYMGSSERHEYTAIGDSVNIASRLCGIARGGEIIASEETVGRAGPGFSLEELPPIQVKGKERSLNAFRVHGLEITNPRLQLP